MTRFLKLDLYNINGDKMNIKKVIILFILSMCFFIYIYKSYKYKEPKYEEVYILQVGAYKNYDNVVKMTKKLDNYLIYEENNLYKIFLGVTLNDNNFKKLESYYNNEYNVFKKVVKISNSEYISNLKKYDTLITKTNDKELLNSIVKKELRELEVVLK